MLLNIAQSHLRAQSFDFFANCGGSGGRFNPLERENYLRCDGYASEPRRISRPS